MGLKLYEHITWDQIASIPVAGTKIPVHMAFSPDNTLLTYLYSPSDSPHLSLWGLDLRTQEVYELAGYAQALTRSLEDELRRERQRMSWEGVTSYQFAKRKPEYLLIPYPNDWHVLNVKTLETDEIPHPPGAEDPYLTPDGQSIVYVDRGSLAVFDRQTRQDRVLAAMENPRIRYGVAEYTAQEEFDRAHGFFVSSDMQWIAFEEVDTTRVPDYAITHLADDPVSIEHHAYPFVGQHNARTRLAVMRFTGEDRQWICWEEFGECYLVDVVWTMTNEMIVQIITRDQRSLIVFRYNPQDRSQVVLWTETAPDWVNTTHDLVVLSSGDVLTTSENNANGFRHLVIRDGHGGERWVTQGPWMVTEIVGVDPDETSVIVQATKHSALERHIYSVDLTSGEMTPLSTQSGTHKAVVSSDFTWIVDQYSSLDTSWVTRLSRLGESEEGLLIGPNPIKADKLGIQEPELVDFKLDDGTILYGAVYKPVHIDPDEKRPVIVAVYGGPHVQTVTNSWGLSVDLQAQYFAQSGYYVVKFDNRGSANRGKAFERVVFHRFGTTELKDQLAALDWIHQRYPTDPDRVGIYGWSYGGFMTLTALMKASDVFKVGVAGAPVTDFRYYDTAYTERYMGTDEVNHAGYEHASVINFVSRLQGRLLVIHGMIDENVHFRHTALLIDALVSEHKDFSLLALPKTRHMPRGFDVLYTIARERSKFFESHL